MNKKIIIYIVFYIFGFGGIIGCDVINAIRLVSMNSDIEPTNNLTKRIKLESEFLGEKPYIYAEVNGEELIFLLDTGSPIFMLHDTPKVRQMNLEKGFQVAFGGWGEEEDSIAFQTELKEFSIGGVIFNNINAAVLPISKSPYFLTEEESIYDGVIGHDIMKHFTWELDATNNNIHISSTKYVPELKAQELVMEESFSKIKIKGTIKFNDSYTATEEFQIDTGSRHYIKLSETYIENNKIYIASPKIKAADFGMKGKVEHSRVSLPSLKLGEISINNVKVNLIPNKDEDEGWIIGNALLNQFKTVLDYSEGKMYLIPQNSFVTDYNLFGLELRKVSSGDFILRYIFPNMATNNLDLKIGDIVTNINGFPSKKISLSDYNDISSKPGKQTVCIKRDNKCVTFVTDNIPGYSMH